MTTADQHAVTETESYVDHVARQYSTEGPEMSVKVPGGRLSVGLSDEHGSWLIGRPAAVSKGCRWSAAI
ncbi:MAG: hypothetical protein GY794_25430 [bacterium]|nr:hypothetical protein [bacterium]